MHYITFSTISIVFGYNPIAIWDETFHGLPASYTGIQALICPLPPQGNFELSESVPDYPFRMQPALSYLHIH